MYQFNVPCPNCHSGVVALHDSNQPCQCGLCAGTGRVGFVMTRDHILEMVIKQKFGYVPPKPVVKRVRGRRKGCQPTDGA
jgi:hypothetical protein